MKSREEIYNLKLNWCRDPCWDIADTEGFEEHKKELWEYQKMKEKEWEKIWENKIFLKAKQLGIPDHLELANYILTLEYRLEQLERKCCFLLPL